jgi:hypothetical protein
MERIDTQHRWLDILHALGLPVQFLGKKHGPQWHVGVHALWWNGPTIWLPGNGMPRLNDIKKATLSNQPSRARSPAANWLSPNSANAWPLQGRIDIVAF